MWIARRVYLAICLSMIPIGVFADSALEKPAMLADNVTEQPSEITKSSWIHGAADCDSNQDPAIEWYAHNEYTYIARQNKCLTFEAPFIFVLVGSERILVLDTGALDVKSDFSLFDEVVKTLGAETVKSKSIIVLHTHGHSDHYKGDEAFSEQDSESNDSVTVVSPKKQAVIDYFNFGDWPQGKAVLDLGERQLTILPSPGHQDAAISIYDEATQWLLTGDTFYPGLIYIKDWQTYKDTVARLTAFVESRPVSAILGTHIEMKQTAGEYYDIGSTYQPEESRLELTAEHLNLLNDALNETTKAKKLVFDDFIVVPMGAVQKTLSNVINWFRS